LQRHSGPMRWHFKPLELILRGLAILEAFALIFCPSNPQSAIRNPQLEAFV
jgi:hypothetical protein